MFNEIRERLLLQYAMQSQNKILNSMGEQGEQSPIDYNVIRRQVQPFINYLQQMEMVDLMEKSIEEYEVNVVVEAPNLQQQIGELFK